MEKKGAISKQTRKLDSLEQELETITAVLERREKEAREKKQKIVAQAGRIVALEGESKISADVLKGKEKKIDEGRSGFRSKHEESRLSKESSKLLLMLWK